MQIILSLRTMPLRARSSGAPPTTGVGTQLYSPSGGWVHPLAGLQRRAQVLSTGGAEARSADTNVGDKYRLTADKQTHIIRFVREHLRPGRHAKNENTSLNHLTSLKLRKR